MLQTKSWSLQRGLQVVHCKPTAGYLIRGAVILLPRNRTPGCKSRALMNSASNAKVREGPRRQKSPKAIPPLRRPATGETHAGQFWWRQSLEALQP